MVGPDGGVERRQAHAHRDPDRGGHGIGRGAREREWDPPWPAASTRSCPVDPDYQATANTPGVDTRTAVVSDGGTPVTVTASLTVAAVNAAPTLAANAVSGTEDTTLTCPAADFTGAAADGRARPSRASQWRPCRRRVGGNSPVPT